MRLTKKKKRAVGQSKSDHLIGSAALVLQKKEQKQNWPRRRHVKKKIRTKVAAIPKEKKGASEVY